MTWRAAHFRTINEARRFATSIHGELYEINGMLHNLLDDCFFQSHMSAVRRLVDTKKLYGPDGVHSLKQLLQDMKRNSSIFTRKAIFDVENLNYDVDRIKKNYDKYITEKLDSGAATFHIPREFNWEIIEDRHKQIDLLTDTVAKDRKPDDHIPKSVFTNLITKIDSACQDVKRHVDKYVAHSATIESRDAVPNQGLGVTLKHLWDSNQELCQVANFVSSHLLGNGAQIFAAIYQYDLLQYLDKPLLPTSKLPELHKVWDRFESEIQTWSDWGIENYKTEFDQ